jgi:N-acetylmuramidase
MEFEARDRTPLTEANLEDAAIELGCEVAAIKAVSEVEAPNGGFIPDGRPELLFESHTFHEQTGGKYDKTHANISTPSWVHNYGAEGAHQYDRLSEAIDLDRHAALMSASWGKYQIMGFNYVECGYDNVEALVADLCDSEAYQLDAFVAYMQNTACGDDLVNKDWSSFALHYNGSGQVPVYAAKIEEAYRRFS